MKEKHGQTLGGLIISLEEILMQKLQAIFFTVRKKMILDIVFE